MNDHMLVPTIVHWQESSWNLLWETGDLQQSNVLTSVKTAILKVKCETADSPLQ